MTCPSLGGGGGENDLPSFGLSKKIKYKQLPVSGRCIGRNNFGRGTMTYRFIVTV
jgi:hypothetical protein